ncbi:MAG: hypothetical protein MJ072_00520, partial [Clostridia bacterium]|nr:hypothetical protein [Clostridia bacterium]
MIKNFNKLDRFPLGSITADGFLKEQLIRSKNGMCGHLKDFEPQMIVAPYTGSETVADWGKENQYGWGAEIAGNYWTGYIQTAFTLHDEEMIKTATWWVDTVLKLQNKDGR